MHSKGEEQDWLVGLVHVARIVDEFKISIYLSIVIIPPQAPRLRHVLRIRGLDQDRHRSNSGVFEVVAPNGLVIN